MGKGFTWSDGMGERVNSTYVRKVSGIRKGTHQTGKGKVSERVGYIIRGQRGQWALENVL